MLAARSDPAFDSLDWQRAIAGAIAEARVDTVVYIPDARLRGIVSALDGPATRILTREEECIAYASGQLAVGRRAMVLMQCSGLGNALNALGSLSIPYELMPPIVLSMRGTLGEGNPAQVPMGRATRPMLEALGIQVSSSTIPTRPPRRWPARSSSASGPARSRRAARRNAGRWA